MPIRIRVRHKYGAQPTVVDGIRFASKKEAQRYGELKLLEKVPVQVLEPMVRRAITTRQYFPRVAELLADAEAVRVELLRALTFTQCAQCSEQGFVEREIDGVKRMVRCQCWKAHQEKIASLGVWYEPLALPPAQEDAWTPIGEAS